MNQNFSPTTSATTPVGNICPELERKGTISSSRFNILCTMVGGGCLSLPLAFQKTGNIFIGPILLIITAIVSDFSYRILITSARIISPPIIIQTPASTSSSQDQNNDDRNRNNQNHRDNTILTTTQKDTYESIAGAAFGKKGLLLTKWLVTFMCFFVIVAYAVLVRDVLQPITDCIIICYHRFHAFGDNSTTDPALTGSSNSKATNNGPSFANNITMWIIVVLITPVCSLKSLSSLRHLGVLSMFSILILGCCIIYRSIQCQISISNMNHNNTHVDYDVDGNNRNFWTGNIIEEQQQEEDLAVGIQSSSWKIFPNNAKDILDAFPLFISVYVCHYNLPLVHNELYNPTSGRIHWWLKSTTYVATSFYIIIGIAGSLYGPCSCYNNNINNSGMNNNSSILSTTYTYNNSTNNNEDDNIQEIHGNILLDFDENDPLLMIGHVCFALSITLAFPLLTIPSRDILLRTNAALYLVKVMDNISRMTGKTISNSHYINNINDDDASNTNHDANNGSNNVSGIVYNNNGTNVSDSVTNTTSIPNVVAMILEVSSSSLCEPLLATRVEWLSREIMEEGEEDTSMISLTSEVGVEIIPSTTIVEYGLSSSTTSTNHEIADIPNSNNNNVTELHSAGDDDGDDNDTVESSLSLRVFFTILVLWSATVLASCVKSIDTVWDLLGSTLSILISYLIPAASYIAIVKRERKKKEQQQQQQQQQTQITTTTTLNVEEEEELLIGSGNDATAIMMALSAAYTSNVDVSDNSNRSLNYFIYDRNENSNSSNANNDDHGNSNTHNNDTDSNNNYSDENTGNNTIHRGVYDDNSSKLTLFSAWMIIIVYTPLMIFSTLNAIENTLK